MLSFYEFFSGGGMAREGLGKAWNCLFANDYDLKKSAVYAKNWGKKELLTCDIRSVAPSDLPGQADLVWSSFPCQDLSLAGLGAGLKGQRSGAFWPFWNLIRALVKEGRAPGIIALENVCGALSSHGGKDFTVICQALAQAGYRLGALVIDAALFVPQSRPRLFVIGVRDDIEPSDAFVSCGPHPIWNANALKSAYNRLPHELKKRWIWWNLPKPPLRNAHLIDFIEDNPKSVSWRTPEQTQQLLEMMNSVNLAKVKDAKRAGKPIVGAVYKRTRKNNDGHKVQRAEVRFDGVAGCLRTPAGGSSRQFILMVNGPVLSSRLLSSREAARLMGLPDDYKLPDNYNEAYHLTGDGVVAPVVRHLAKHIFEPILYRNSQISQAAA